MRRRLTYPIFGAISNSPNFALLQVETDYDKDVYSGDIRFVRAIDNSLGDVTIDFDGRPGAARHELTRSSPR